MSKSSDTKNLMLIVEAVKYCRHVRELGMPLSCYSKALREPVHFLWECREKKNKYRAAKFCSENAKSLPRGKVTYDHAIPFKDIQSKLLGLSKITSSSVRDVLAKYAIAVIITRVEDSRLTKAGYRSSMPKGWDGGDPFARYKALDIKIVENV